MNRPQLFPARGMACSHSCGRGREVSLLRERSNLAHFTNGISTASFKNAMNMRLSLISDRDCGTAPELPYVFQETELDLRSVGDHGIQVKN
jgi:hypothetical protein